MLRAPQQQQERVGDPNDADDVGLKDRGSRGAVKGVDVGPGGRTMHSGVVDEHVNAAFVSLDVFGGQGDRIIVGDIDCHEPGAELIGGGLAALRISGADDDRLAELDEAAGCLVAKAFVSPGDECDGGHAISLVHDRAGEWW